MEYLGEFERIRFPDPENANPWGVVAQGGNLSPGVLLSAYEQGIFPWYEENPILWFSPDPRFVLFLEEFHVGRRLRRTIRKSSFRLTFDRDFPSVIAGCREPRDLSGGTWITSEMEEGYTRLNELGRVHSVEVWDGTALVGGLYGVLVGAVFAGESMFSRRRDASKFALVALVGFFRDLGVPFIDCQSFTSHMAAFGAREIRRRVFLEHLEENVTDTALIPTNWTEWDANAMLQRGLQYGSA